MSNWVYIRSEPSLWTVGFYDPKGEWQPESGYPTTDEAAARVRWLNGGNDPVKSPTRPVESQFANLEIAPYLPMPATQVAWSEEPVEVSEGMGIVLRNLLSGFPLRAGCAVEVPEYLRWVEENEAVLVVAWLVDHDRALNARGYGLAISCDGNEPAQYAIVRVDNLLMTSEFEKCFPQEVVVKKYVAVCPTPLSRGNQRSMEYPGSDFLPNFSRCLALVLRDIGLAGGEK